MLPSSLLDAGLGWTGYVRDAAGSQSLDDEPRRHMDVLPELSGMETTIVAKLKRDRVGVFPRLVGPARRGQQAGGVRATKSISILGRRDGLSSHGWK